MGGFLTGKYSKATPPPAGSRYDYNQRLWQRVNQESNFEVLENLERVAQDAGISMSKLAIAWILKNPIVTAPIVGASSIEQVEENCRLTEINLGDEIYRRLNDLTKNVSVPLYS
jgi:aryl-alcohol dehydrogenase-like predicted oxidoreductase